ncbi:MAG: metal-dependent hydrolase [Bacteroidota bacterium]
MDSLTHIAIGACAGEWMAGRQLGRRAMLWGALAHSLPDIDFIAGFWNDAAEDLLAHRGFTHSIVFAGIAMYLLVQAHARLHPGVYPVKRKAYVFFGVLVFLHLLLDGFNVYGTGWFEPFSHLRIAFNWLFVADPFFSIGPGIACLLLLLLKRKHPWRSRFAKLGLLCSFCYLSYAGVNKQRIDRSVRQEIARRNWSDSAYMTTPTPFNTWLWYVVVNRPNGAYIAHRSLFDRCDTMSFHYFPRRDSLLYPLFGHEPLQHLIRFSQGYYLVDTRNDSLIFSDLRFGQQQGWNEPTAPFVFYYYLSHPENNHLIIQRGRFKGWGMDAIRRLWERIGGWGCQ